MQWKKQSRTGALTVAVLNYLNLNGFKAWRNNNVGVYSIEKQAYLKPKVSAKGMPDINGLDWNGRYVGVEIKTKDDRCSVEQTKFAAEIIARNGVYIIAGEIYDVIGGLQYYGYNIADNGSLQGTVMLSWKERIINAVGKTNAIADQFMPNANKLKFLSGEQKATLSYVVKNTSMNMINILGKYSERVL